MGKKSKSKEHTTIKEGRELIAKGRELLKGRQSVRPEATAVSPFEASSEEEFEKAFNELFAESVGLLANPAQSEPKGH